MKDINPSPIHREDRLKKEGEKKGWGERGEKTFKREGNLYES